MATVRSVRRAGSQRRGDGVGDRLEHGIQLGADQGDGRDDEDGDERGDQAVLDGGGAGLALHKRDKGLHFHSPFSISITATYPKLAGVRPPARQGIREIGRAHV